LTGSHLNNYTITGYSKGVLVVVDEHEYKKIITLYEKKPQKEEPYKSSGFKTHLT
jgi:hypothetical protein